MTYGEVLSQILREQNVKPAELARRIGKSRSYVSQLISGKVEDPSLTVAFAIASALSVTLQSMVDQMNEDEEA